MKTINIFVASAFELTDWRNIIGDAIRQWSDFYEPKGFRIKMLCWEDYHPEYNGVRMQNQYNEDLVKKSHIFIGLFRNRCGMYTQEEIQVADSQVELSRHTYLFGDSNGKPNKDLKYFIAQHKGRIAYKGNVEEVLGSIKNILEDYISRLPQYLPQDVAQSKTVYATVGDDIFHEKYALGNVIRSLDCLAENELNMRCRLLREDITLIDKSDYFIGIVRDHVSNEKEQEICKALLQSGHNSHPQVSALYFNHDDGILQNQVNIKLQQVYADKGVFNEAFDSYHRIKFNLLVWLLSHRVLQINEYSGLEISSSWVKYMGRKIIPTHLLDLEGNNNRELLKNLLKQIYEKLLFPHILDSNDANNPMDVKKLDEAILTLDFAEQTGEYLLDKTGQNRLGLLKDIESRMAVIYHGPNYASELIQLNFRKERILRSLLKCHLVQVEELLRTLIDIIGLYHKYPSLFDDDFDEDGYFLAACDIADEHGVIMPEIEKFRMNYANYLSRHNKNNEALQLYELSLSRLNQMNDGTKLMTSYLISNYLNFTNSLLELNLYDEGKKFINDYQNLIDGYARKHPDDKENTSYEITALTSKLRIWKYEKDAQINLWKAINIWNKIKENPIYVSDNLWDDIYCYFPTVIAAVITDSSVKFEENKGLVSDAIQILNDSIGIIKKSKRIDSEPKLHHLAQHNHNIANIISEHIGNQIAARKFALKSLDYRRKLYDMTHHEHILAEIANIQLMIGATYINGRTKYLPVNQSKKALWYAEQSFDTFKSLNNEGFPGPETKEKEAQFLIGTILFFTRHREQEGFKLIEECHSWHLKHPNNDYADTFESEYQKFNKIKSERDIRMQEAKRISPLEKIAKREISIHNITTMDKK